MKSPVKGIAIVGLIAAPAMGQVAPQNAMQTPPAPTTGTAPPDANTGTADSGTIPARPSSWTGTDAAWARHVRNCRKRGGYDPATDQYRTSSGALRDCPR